MTFDEAVLAMHNDKPRFGIIVENTETCKKFLDELEQHVPEEWRKPMSLRDYAFRRSEKVSIVTLSQYRHSYDRWSDFESVEYALSYSARDDTDVYWVLYTEVGNDDSLISDLNDILFSGE